MNQQEKQIIEALKGLIYHGLSNGASAEQLRRYFDAWRAMERPDFPDLRPAAPNSLPFPPPSMPLNNLAAGGVFGGNGKLSELLQAVEAMKQMAQMQVPQMQMPSPQPQPQQQPYQRQTEGAIEQSKQLRSTVEDAIAWASSKQLEFDPKLLAGLRSGDPTQVLLSQQTLIEAATREGYNSNWKQQIELPLEVSPPSFLAQGAAMAQERMYGGTSTGVHPGAANGGNGYYPEG